MKRSELTVGAELYYDAKITWKGYGGGSKAVVLAVEPYEQPSASYLSRAVPAPRPTRDGKGSGVYVEVQLPGYASRCVVSLSHLRGPYDEVAKQVEASVAARREREKRESEARVNAARFAADVVEAARNTGFTSADFIRREGEFKVLLDPADVIRLLDAYRGGTR